MQHLTAVVIVTHGRAGADMIQAAESVLNLKIAQLTSVGVDLNDDTDVINQKIDQALRALHVSSDENVLFLVDLVGSTPARLCCKKCSTKGHVVTGVNMPMLLKLATVDRSRGPAVLGRDLAHTGTKSIHCE